MIASQEGHMPATATPTATWRRISGTDEWGVAVPRYSTLRQGRTVTVTSRSGRTSEVVLGEYVAAWTTRDGEHRATFRVDRTAARPTPAETPAPPLGTHVLETDGEVVVIRVQRTRRGRGYPAAWTMDRTRLTATGRARWTYVGRNLFGRLSAATLITEAQAREIGGRFGFCVNCGRVLRADESVDRGIGPVCWRRIRANQALLAYADNVPTDDDDLRAELTGRIDRARRLAAQLEEHGVRGTVPADETEAAELLDDNTDPDDDGDLQLPPQALGADGRMTSEWFDATAAMDREELEQFIGSLT